VDVIDGAFVLKHVNSGIQGDYQPPTNVELIELARSEEASTGLTIPFGYAPAVFSRKLLENDFKKNLVCYEWTPDEAALSRSYACLLIILRPFFMGVIKTFDEVISRIDRTTSPGYPWNLRWRTKGDALDQGMQIFRDLVLQVQRFGKIDYHFEVRSGFVIHLVHVFYMTSPKGELRTVDKLLAEDESSRKTRTFMPGCLLLHIISLMLYSDQNDQMLNMAGEREWSAVGMTPWYGGWNSMAEYLLSGTTAGEKQFVCCDVKHMESSLNDYVQTKINRLRNECLAWGNTITPEYTNMMTWYQEQSTQLYIIGVNGWLYFRTCVNPSGKLNTLNDNTIALMWVFLYVVATVKMTVAEVLEVYGTTPAKMVGDDSIVQYRPWLGLVFERARDMGFDIRLEVPISPLRDAVFLNAGFYWSGSMWYFRPNFDKIRASIFFLWKSRSWRLAYVKVCAYRQLVFPFLTYRREADRMLSYILKYHGDEMRHEHSMDSRITYASARASLMSDEENYFLTTGLESTRWSIPEGGQSVGSRVRRSRVCLFDAWVDLWKSADSMELN